MNEIKNLYFIQFIDLKDIKKFIKKIINHN